MGSSGSNIGTTQVVFQADTKSGDVALRNTANEFAKAGLAAAAAGDKVVGAGNAIDRSAKLQEQALARARAAWDRELMAQDRAAESARETARAQELLALKNDILARSANEAAAATEGGALRMQNSIGLLDNAIRGQKTRAFADIIRGMSTTGIVMAALPIAATAAGIAILVGVVGEAATKFREWREAQERVAEGMQIFHAAVQEVFNGLQDKLLQAGIEADDLTGNHLDALKKKLELIDHQSMDDLRGEFNKLAEAANKVLQLKELASHWYTPGAGSDYAQGVQTKFGAVYGWDLVQGKEDDAKSLLKNTLGIQQKVLDLEAAINKTPEYLPLAGGGRGVNPAYYDLARQLKPYGLAGTSQELQSQQTLVDLLTAQQGGPGKEGVQSDVDQLMKLLKGNAIGSSAKRWAPSQMEAWRQQLSEEKAQHEMTLGEEADFWQKRADSVKRGSVLYNEALQQANNARAVDLKQYQGALFAGWVEDARASQRGGKGTGSNQYGLPSNMLDEQAGEQMRAQDEATRKQQEAATKAFEESAKLLLQGEKEAEDALRIQSQEGLLSPYQLALEMQALHGQTASGWMRRSAAFSAQNPDLPVPGGAEAMHSFDLQQQQDDAAVRATSTLGELSDATLRLAQDWSNLGRTLSAFSERTLGSFNETLVRQLSTPASMTRGKYPWRNMGAGVAESAGMSALQYGEGTALKFLLGDKFGAKLGTKGNPMYVIAADSVAAGASGALGGLGLLGKIFGGGGTTSAPAGGSSVGAGIGAGISGLLGGFMPHFAAGGEIRSNLPALVGERGPEILTGAAGRTVVPNSRIGGNITVHNHIDARAATDPAAVAMAAHRAVDSRIAQMRGMAKNEVSDHNRRVPPSRRI